jgi:glutamine kinase
MRKNDFSFGTKAETLERLAPSVSLCSVPSFFYFENSRWTKQRDGVVEEIQAIFKNGKVAVRSSALAEDGSDHSMAGMFVSILNVDVGDTQRLSKAIEDVIDSYHRDNRLANPEDQILIQEMVQNVEMSGVLFTQDLNSGAPYYVIEYDDESGLTDTVTAGNGYSNRTLYVHRGALNALRSERFRTLVSAVLELERIIDSRSLDVEFTIDENADVHLLQVRRITTRSNWNRGISVQIDNAIVQIRSFIRGRMKPCHGIHGHQSVFGQMPDWNPAEMIGRAPRPLALSLYQHLITDKVWRVARREMGYAEPAGTPLMVALSGQPYIDVRLSFHSFLPADLPAEIGNKLVTSWLDRLIDNHALHDKVEFDIAVTALSFDFYFRVDQQFPNALTPSELEVFKESLQRLTHKLIKGDVASIESQLEKIEELAKQQTNMVAKSTLVELRSVASLLEQCVELGTLPFSVLARHGFIAQSFLKSLVSTNCLTTEECNALLASIKTIAGEFTEDSRRFAAGEINRKAFMERYGHLRPGTYDILSPRYDQRTEIFGSKAASRRDHATASFELKSQHETAIAEQLKVSRFDISPQDLIEYIKEATAAREYAKFVFTRNISDALEKIAIWGENMRLSREELSLLELKDILDCMVVVDGDNVENRLRQLSATAAENYKVTQALRLPQLIFDEEGTHVIPLSLSEPNFITHSNISGECILLNGHEDKSVDLDGKIILIENADPGFDWIFTYSILGLITRYGGANSHMAIRCSEFGLPAAIGCGEQIFEHLSQAKEVEIKCAEGQINVLDHQ